MSPTRTSTGRVRTDAALEVNRHPLDTREKRTAINPLPSLLSGVIL
jgi:hypothetical protein